MAFVKKTKCDFCQYKTARGCMVDGKSFYCRQANDELFRWIEEQKKKSKKA